MAPQQANNTASLVARNVGGITETEVTFTPGVTVLKGQNTTNRTSLLQAIMGALGSSAVSIKSDADTATVELEMGDTRYSCELDRDDNRTVRTAGEPYLEDAEIADLFAFLIESNEVRRAVTGQQDLRELIMRPVDTDEINREIDQLIDQRREVERKLENLDSLKDRLPTLEKRRTKLKDEIKVVREELDEIEEKIVEHDVDVKEKRAEQAELEDHLEELQSRRSTLDDVRYNLETERDGLESLRAEKRELADEFNDAPETSDREIEEQVTERDRLRERKRRFESQVNEIQSVLAFNQEMMDGTDNGVLNALHDSEGDVTDELLPAETVTCWTCGSEVHEDEIKTTIDHLQELSQNKLGEVNDLEAQIDEITTGIQELREKQQQREEINRQLERTEQRIEESEATIERLTDRREELRTQVEELESEIDDFEDVADDEILELHKDANELEYDLGRLEGDREDVEDEIANIESQLNKESELRQRHEELNREIEELRTKIDRIEDQAVQAFNDHMGSILDILEFSNIERIWLERVEQDVRDGRQKVTKNKFELHIVRSTDGGATYEDTIEHLSESEREVTGIILGLAGYLAHSVYEDCPFMLLDSLEAIDANRISRLVQYMEEYSEFLIVALLPEDANALPEGYERVTEI